jgi:hypothetical protein
MTTQREGGKAEADSAPDSRAATTVSRRRDTCVTRESPLYRVTRRDCLPGCTSRHPPGLPFAVCEAPEAALGADAHTVAVSTTRVAEPGEPDHHTVTLTVDDREGVELDPATARAMARALCRAAGRVEHQPEAA